MKPRDLLARAQGGLRGRGGIRSAFVRRAISDAYYALFHALADMCANSLVGPTRRRSESWRRVYRTIDHGQVREELRRADVIAIHAGVAKLASDFSRLQDARHVADYDPATVFRHRRDAVALLSVAEDAISAIEALPADARLELSAALATKRRR